MAMPRQVRSLRVADEAAHAHVGRGLRSIVLLRWSNHAQAICGLVFAIGSNQYYCCDRLAAQVRAPHNTPGLALA